MTTSVMMDLIIVAALALFAFLGWKRGLIRTLAELLLVIVALFLANQIADLAAPKIVDSYLRPPAHEVMVAKVEELFVEGNFEGSLEGLKDGARQLLESIPGSFLRKHAQTLLEEGESGIFTAVSYPKAAILDLGLKAVDAALDGVVLNLVRSIIFAVCFAVLTILLRLAVKLLNFTFTLPGLKQLNEIGGMLIGLGKGAIVVCLVIWVLILAGVLTEEVMEESALLKLAADIMGAAGEAV